MLVRLMAIACFFAMTRIFAQPFAVPDSETAYAPSRERLAALVSAAERDGWAPQIAALHAAALRAYARDNLVAANGWFHVYAWTCLFAEAEGAFVSRWIAAVNEANVGHANMPRAFSKRRTPLAAALSPDLRTWMIGEGAFSEEFFGLISPVDYLPGVFEILNTLYRLDPAQFKTYANLALAIAVVYDVPPPPQWPHGQVTLQALPRKFVPPVEAFAWWIRQDQLGHTYHRLKKLSPEELKFVVDTPAPLTELAWAQQSVPVPLGEFARAYSMVRYRTERLTKNQTVWAGPSYRLADILSTGGICADQAYFAAQVGKAHGVPTLFFRGAGEEGRHAWFGYLDGDLHWQLDAGRYAERRYLTGYAYDPQTWREFTDHELQFVKEHFRGLPSFRQSRVHTAFANDLLSSGDAAGAALAARKAVNYERRNQAAWEVLIAATQKQGGDPKATEVVLREAALAFQRYPDLEAFYVGRVAERLRARGQTSEAEAVIQHIAHKNQDSRVDISVSQARDILLRAFETEPLDRQIRAYNYVVDTFGAGAGMTFLDQVVVVFAEHMVQLQHKPEALRGIDRARQTLKVDPHSQLESEFARLQQFVEKTK